MDATGIQRALVVCGWPIDADGKVGPQTRRAIADYQRGNALVALDDDGVAGSLTQAALAASVDDGGRCSGHFAYREFASAGDGWIRVNAALVWGLDRYRDAIGGPVRPISGYRDPAHNASVGGASNSQHLYGNACDLPQQMSLDDVVALGAFSGIGVVRSNGLAAHVDVRHTGPNTTGASLADPTIWYYEG